MWEALQEYGVYGAESAPGRRPESYWAGYPEAPVVVRAASQSPDAIAGRALTPEEAARLFEEQHGDLSPVLNELKDAIINGNPQVAIEKANKALAEGVSAATIINDVVIPSMEIVGSKFECGDYFLPEMMASAIGTQGVMKALRPKLVEGGGQPAATAAIGTVKGDLHDIGKNLVAMMWEGAGFNVIDLGPDVPAEKFVSAIREHNVQLVGLSALLTTTMPMMGKIITAIEEAGLRERVKIMIGGPGTTPEFASEIGADGYAPDASAAVRRAKELLAG
ncbi:MAG: corrinoid protein [Anaerolineae bacterium]|nr:corrinoid protein [Anaerolineae bacterium]